MRPVTQPSSATAAATALSSKNNIDSPRRPAFSTSGYLKDGGTLWWGKKKETKDVEWGGGDNAVEGAVTGDNKGRGGDDEEAEAGERAAQKKAKNKRKP